MKKVFIFSPVVVVALSFYNLKPNKSQRMHDYSNQASVQKPSQDPTDTKTLTIGFYLQDGVEVLDFAGPLEVFSYAGFPVITISKKTETLLSQGVLKVTPDYSIDNAPPFDVLAVFGGNASAAYNDPRVIDWVRHRASSVKYLFSVCTGAFILGKAGLLKGRTATTFHLSLFRFKKDFTDTKVLDNVRFVDNGNLITTAGISAGIDGALHLVEKIKGPDEAKRIARMMEYDKWVPQSGYIVK
jgi:transcriptional regulator GlxA family with amidase domain